MEKTYYARVEGFLEGRYRKVGEPIEMTAQQAKYLLMDGNVSEDPPPPVAKKPAKVAD